MTARAAGPEPVDEFVPIGGMTIRVRRAGQGPPLLLINGIGAAIELLEPLTSRLGDREIITFDLPGTGRSTLPRRPMRMGQIAAVVGELIDALGYARVDVLGYSFGGAVAQELAFREPSKVGRLLLCATTPGLPAVPPRLSVIAMMLTPARYYSRGLGAFIVPRIAGGRTARDHTTLFAGLTQRQQHPPSLVGYTLQMSAITGWSSHRFLTRIAAETLVLHGDDDPVAPLINARWMACRIPNARLRVLSGCGHLFLLDETEAAVEDIRSFLDASVRGAAATTTPRTKDG